MTSFCIGEISGEEASALAHEKQGPNLVANLVPSLVPSLALAPRRRRVAANLAHALAPLPSAAKRKARPRGKAKAGAEAAGARRKEAAANPEARRRSVRAARRNAEGI